MYTKRLALFMLLVSIVFGLWLAPSIHAIPSVKPIRQAANVQFDDDFEAAKLGAGWTTDGTNNGSAALTGNYHHSGAQAVFLGQTVNGLASATLTLALDLTSQTDVFLDFWARSTGSAANHRVAISDNAGASWTEIDNLDDASQSFGHQLLDIAALATAKGVALNNTFRIRFAYSNNSAFAGNGFVVDDVQLTTRAREVAPSPFAQDSFEKSDFQQGLYPQSTLNGVAELTTDYHHSGAQAVFLGQAVNGLASATLTLALDLSGQTDVFLDFWARSTGSAAIRRVAISDNAGASWAEIDNLDDMALSFGHELLDIAALATAKGVALNNMFRIRFAYTNNTQLAGNGFVIDDVRLTTRANEIAPFPFERDGFETGDFQQGLYPQSTFNGVAEFTTDSAQSGTRSVFLGQRLNGLASASLTLALDLTGQPAVFLDFWARPTGTAAVRTLAISGDGGTTWKQIIDLSNVPQGFSHQTINVASAANSNGVSLNNKFRIRFAYSNNAQLAGNGLLIDDLSIVATNAATSRIVYLPLVRH